MIWRSGIIVAFVVGAAILAYQIGSRLSDQAIMTIVGVLCGILASIPVSIGLLIALTRERTSYYGPDADALYQDPAPSAYPVYRPAPPPQPQTPQVIVVAPPQAPLAPHLNPYANYLLPPSSAPGTMPMQERNFKIVGDEEEE